MKAYPPTPTASLGFGIIPKPKESKTRFHDAPPGGRKARILVADSDPEICRVMAVRLGAAKYTVEPVDSARAALDACVMWRPSLVITELRMKDTEGLAFLKELKSRWPQLIVIILTAHGTIAEAVQATQCGAFSYLVKPVGKEELLGQVERALAISTFAQADGDWRANMASRGQLMEKRLGAANRAANSDVPVLLTGENGTGKELLARAIHAASVRRDSPFVTMSCRSSNHRALASVLLDEKSTESKGKQLLRNVTLQLARGGTLLLDEIDKLPKAIQAKLATSLANGQVMSGESARGERSDVRLICTTSRDLKALAETGAFLKALYDQINVLPLDTPPLGRRSEDIPLLISHFLEQAHEPGGQRPIYTPKAIELLATTDWPENVRQLFDLVKRNMALSHGETAAALFVPKPLSSDPTKIPGYNEARDKFSRDYLADNLQRTAGNVTQAARLAKRSRTDFYKLLARYRLHPEDFKGSDEEG